MDFTDEQIDRYTKALYRQRTAVGVWEDESNYVHGVFRKQACDTLYSPAMQSIFADVWADGVQFDAEAAEATGGDWREHNPFLSDEDRTMYEQNATYHDVERAAAEIRARRG